MNQQLTTEQIEDISRKLLNEPFMVLRGTEDDYNNLLRALATAPRGPIVALSSDSMYGKSTMPIEIERMNDVFTKYHLNPKGELPIPLRPVIHQFTGLEVGEQPHDHPFDFYSYVLFGSYVERIYTQDAAGFWVTEDVFRAPHTVHHVPATRIHQIVGMPDGQATTLIDAGPKIQEPAFYKFGGIAERRQWDSDMWLPYQPEVE